MFYRQTFFKYKGEKQEYKPDINEKLYLCGQCKQNI